MGFTNICRHNCFRSLLNYTNGRVGGSKLELSSETAQLQGVKTVLYAAPGPKGPVGSSW
jgi:hypothetical protein